MTIERKETKRGHTYRIDGEQVPGVTTIIDAALPKPAIAKWRSKTVAQWVASRMPRTTFDDGHADFAPDGDGLLIDELYRLAHANERYIKPGNVDDVVSVLSSVPDFDRDIAARRGTEVHGLAERYIKGEEVIVPDELAGHFKAYQGFLETWQPRDELVEVVIAHRALRYCGTFDLAATLIDGRRWLLDLKTTRSGVFDEVALQLAGYRFAEVMLDADGNEQPMPEFDDTGVVWLTPHGWTLYRVETSLRVWQAFQRLVHMRTYINATKDELVSSVSAIEQAAAAS